MNISEKKAVFVLVYMIRIKHDAYSCLHVLLMIKNLGQVCQQRMRCTLHRWDSMHLHKEQF